MLDFIGGLLDNPGRAVGIGPEQIDPNARWAYRGMVLQALGNSLSGGTPFYQGINSIREGMDARTEAELKARQAQAALEQQKQLQQMFAQGAVEPGQGGAGQPGGNPNKAKADMYRRAAQMVAATNPEAAKKYMDLATAMDPTPDYGQPQEVMGPDGKPMLAQFDKTGAVRPVSGYGPKPAAAPTDVREYQFAVSQGYKGTYEQWILAQKKAGATNVSQTVNTEKSFLGPLAGKVAGMVADSATAAQAAQSALGTIGQIRQALPNSFTGPGADARVVLSRLQGALGVGGANDEEKLANTAKLVQGLAQAELDAAQQMKGQGQITEAERALIARAAAGSLGMMPGEIMALTVALEKVARAKIAAHQRNVQSLGQMEGAGPILPFFATQGGAQVPAPAMPGGGSIQDAAAAELARRRGGR